MYHFHHSLRICFRVGGAVIYHIVFVKSMSFTEDNDCVGCNDEGYCTVCCGSFRGWRGLSSHLYRSVLCSASDEVLCSDEGSPAASRLTRSLTLGGRNESNDNLTNNLADTSLSDDDATLPFERLLYPPPLIQGMLSPASTTSPVSTTL